MSIGNASGLNLGLLGNELSSLSGLTRLNPNLCNLGNLSGAATLAASLGTNLQSYSTTNSNSPTIRSSSSNTQGAIIVDDEDDDQNSFTSESTAEICRSVYEQRVKLANKSNLRLNSVNTNSNRLSTGSTGSSASSSVQSLAQTTPPTLSLLEQQHSLINSAAHLPQHPLHSQAHHPLSHQTALLNLNQSNLPTSLNEATNSIISSCATSSATTSSAANTASTNQNSTNLTSVSLSQNTSDSNSSNTTTNLHHQSPYNLSALNSFSNLSNLNSFGVYNPLAMAAHQQSVANRNNDNQSSTQQSTIHHHPLFSNAASGHQPNFNSLIEHGSSLGLSNSSILPDILSNNSSRLLSDSVFQLDSLTNNSQVAKNLLSAINPNSMHNSAINQRAQQHLQQLQLHHHLQHQNHLQQLHNQQQRLARSKSHDSDNSDLDEQYDSNEFNQLRQLDYLKSKDKRVEDLKEGDESKGKKKDKRDLEMSSNKNKQNGHCNNSKLDHHFNERDDDEDDYSNYNKKKIFIFSTGKPRRNYQSTNSSNQTSSSNSNNSSGNNGKKCPQNNRDSEYDYEFIDCDSDNEQNSNSKDDCFFLDKSINENHNENTVKLHQNQNELISSATEDISKIQISKPFELNSSINSTYSSGSVISCCGTTRTDVNSSTNSNDDENPESKREHFKENEDEKYYIESMSDDDTGEDTVLQKKADSTNSIISNGDSKGLNELTDQSTSTFSIESEFRSSDHNENFKKTPINKLVEGLTKLSLHLNKSENEHLTDYLALAFIEDNGGEIENCIDKINQGKLFVCHIKCLF